MMQRHITFDAKGHKQIVEREAPPANEARLLARRRARMRCRPASLRLALHRAGRLAEVETIASGDPEAAIVWEYMTTAERMSPLIEAMAGEAFTDEEIDTIFEIAMAME